MNVSRYDKTARSVNAPLYKYYAEKIKERTGIVTGCCLDVGCGGGYLGLALAAITDLDFIFLDISSEMLERAQDHIVEDGLGHRAKTLLADVHDIPIPDASVDLVISRGSIPFWKEPGQALIEIYRVLSPQGKAFVGGGKGTPEMRERLERQMKKDGMTAPDRSDRKHGGPLGRMQKRDYGKIIKAVGIPGFTVLDGQDGRWIQIWK